MSYFLLLLVLLSLIGADVKKEKEFYTDYASVDKSNSIKGFFVILVFFSHLRSYVNFSDANSKYYLGFQGYLAQMIVVPFLFFSGYGIMCSIMKKKTDYVKKIPTTRILKVLLHFDIAVVLFLIFDMFIDREVDLKKFLLSLVGWDSIGNSNWYIFMILICYAVTFIGFIIFRKNYYLGALLTIGLLAFIIWILTFYRPGYYYNTGLVYGLGLLWGLFKDKIDKVLSSSDFVWIVALGISAAIYYLAHKNKANVWYYELWACMFMVLILILSMKICINNGILQFFGKHIFSIYILQRLPMDALKHIYNVAEIKYIYLITSFIITLIIALIFDWLMDKLDGVIWRRKKA